jgi:hypothetical protein
MNNNYSKYIILNFKNAGIYDNKKSDNYKYYSYNKVFDRSVRKYEKYVTYHQVSGMLHKLFGEIPPNMHILNEFDDKIKNGEIPDIVNKKIVDIAKRAYIKYTNIPILEIQQTSKSAPDSISKTIDITWERLRIFLNYDSKNERIGDLYDEYLDICVKLLNNPNITINNLTSKISALDMLNKIVTITNYYNSDLIENFKNKLNANRKKLFANCLEHCVTYEEYDTNRKVLNQNKNPKIFSLVMRGVNSIIRLDGQIIIPLLSDEEKFLKNLKHFGCATLLDSGLVTIDSIVNADETSPFIDLVSDYEDVMVED